MRSPPLVRIEDHGLRWELTGESLVLMRKPTVTTALFPVAAIGLLFLIGAMTFINGGPRLTVVLSFVAIFFVLVSLLVRLRVRLELHAGPTGVQWRGLGAHENSGKWSKGSITGVHVMRGRRPTLWGAHQVVNTELCVGGDWVTIAWGFDYDRSKELANAFKTALAVPEQVEDLSAR